MNDNLKAYYDWHEKHCIVCGAEVEPVLLTDTSYQYTRFCTKPECQQQQEQYYNSFW